MQYHLIALAALTSVTLAGCVATEKVIPDADEGVISLKNHYSTFTDATWLPEKTIRAPYGSPEIYPDIIDVMTRGIYAFYGTEESKLSIMKTSVPGLYAGNESQRRIEPTLSFSKGSSTVFRNGNPIPSLNNITASKLEDGRLMFSSSGKASINVAVKLRAFNVSGKPVLHFIRNASNQPDDLAWYMDPNITFPAGSEAYVFTYWLGDDEIVVPASNSFTGTKSIEELMNRYSKKVAPLCMNYIHSRATTPYGVMFPALSTTPTRVTKEITNAQGKVIRRVTTTERPKAAPTGTLTLLKARSDAIFCEIPKETSLARATWKMRSIQGTRVMEIIPDKNVSPADVGIQPINQSSVGVGFAETIRVHKGVRSTNVVPVNILRNNRPIVEFRLKFNEPAAAAVRKALVQAAQVKQREAKLIAEQAKKRRSAK